MNIEHGNSNKIYEFLSKLTFSRSEVVSAKYIVKTILWSVEPFCYSKYLRVSCYWVWPLGLRASIWGTRWVLFNTATLISRISCWSWQLAFALLLLVSTVLSSLLADSKYYFSFFRSKQKFVLAETNIDCETVRETCEFLGSGN